MNWLKLKVWFGLLVFNGTFSINRPYCDIGIVKGWEETYSNVNKPEERNIQIISSNCALWR